MKREQFRPENEQEVATGSSHDTYVSLEQAQSIVEELRGVKLSPAELGLAESSSSFPEWSVDPVVPPHKNGDGEWVVKFLISQKTYHKKPPMVQNLEVLLATIANSLPEPRRSQLLKKLQIQAPSPEPVEVPEKAVSIDILPRELQRVYELDSQTLKVQRSDGTFEDGWAIMGSPFKDEGEWVVKVRRKDGDKNLTKDYPIAELLELNP